MEEQIQKAIKQREQLLKKMAIGTTALSMFENEQLPFFLCVFDLERLEFLTVSKSCFSILGYTQQEMEGGKFIDFIANEQEAKKGLEAIDDNLKTGVDLVGFQNNYKHKDGSIVKIIWYTGKGQDSKTFAIGIPKK